MARVVIENERLGLEIEPALGAGIAGLWLDVGGGVAGGGRIPILRPAPERAEGFADLACYLMAPWCNRIAGARFEFGGRSHQLRVDWPDGTAIHGDVKNRAWRLLDRSPFSARLAIDSSAYEANFPFPYGCEVRYEVEGPALNADLVVRNTGTAPMPCGCGFHPFFPRGGGRGGGRGVHVLCRTAGRYPSRGGVPTGPPVPDAVVHRLAEGGPLADLELDDVFAGFDGRALLSWPASGVGAEVACSEALGHVVIYSPAGGAGCDWFCLEPASMVNDGLNALALGCMGTGVVVLGPGEALRARMTITAACPSRRAGTEG